MRNNNFYSNIKNNKHIFIYSVCGKTKSTFLQRLINSSNEICIFGEPHYIVDKCIDFINQMKKYNGTDIQNLELGFTENYHKYFCANSINKLDLQIDKTINIFAEIFKPINNTNRFGYKEIRIKNIKTLEFLNEYFPKSFFIFIFRDPIKQWPSVKACKYWTYSQSLELFLCEYERISNIYLKFKGIFIEDNYITNINNFKFLKIYLKINNFDKNVLKLKTGITKNKKNLTNYELLTIKDSKAYNNYLIMKNNFQIFTNQYN